MCRIIFKNGEIQCHPSLGFTSVPFSPEDFLTQGSGFNLSLISTRVHFQRAAVEEEKEAQRTRMCEVKLSE